MTKSTQDNSDVTPSLDTIVTNTIRTLSMDAVQKANSGHPGTPMALAPVAYVLWDSILKYNPHNPHWPNRDRFVLSVGHASMLLYSALHLSGYDVSLDDIKNFRQLHSKCAGHPEYGHCPGVETTTGPLGQGVANSVGMAIAEKWMAKYFNRPGHSIIDHKVIALASDGCMMEGISHEAASLAGHLALGNLIWIYDNNRITIEGSIDLAFSEDVGARFLAYGWHVQHVRDGNDVDALKTTLANAKLASDKPTLVIVDTHIAWGSPNKQDSCESHGAPLGEDEIRATKAVYGWDPDKHFHIPEETATFTEGCIARGASSEKEWNERFEAYRAEFPDLAFQFEMIQRKILPKGWDAAIPTFPADPKGIATRDAGGKILNAVAPAIPWLMGGSADLGSSTKTVISKSTSFSKESRDGRNFHFGIREHAMGAITNGMALSGLRPYGSTFLIFQDYMRPAVRLSALMKLPTMWIFTHDSIGLGEDGPTHQPVEQVMTMRTVPGLDVIRPADANELAVLWKYALSLTDHPVAFALTRQALPTLDRTKYAPADNALKGGYVLADCKGTPDVILIGTGSEVHLCLAAGEKLTVEGKRVRVVSLPCWELFERQSESHRESVLPSSVKARVAVEAGCSLGWERYVGNAPHGQTVCIDSFGASAPAGVLFKEYGFTIDNVVAVAKRAMGK